MKKFNILSLVFLSLLFIPFITNASLDTNLYYGLQNNSDVRELQEFLIDKGFLNYEATGNFFSSTLNAVKAYQKKQGIIQTGYVGILTRAAINSELAKQLSGSNAEATTETGTTLPIPAPQKATNDVVSAILAQIALLQKQINALNVQQVAVQPIAQNNQAIKQNDLPIVVPNPIPVENLAEVSFSATTTPSNASIDPQNEVMVWQNIMTIKTRVVDMTRIRFRKTGSVSNADLQNFKLYVDGIQVGSTVELANDSMGSSYATFDLSGTPKRLDEGTRTIKVSADIVGGSNLTFAIHLWNVNDVSFIDIQHNKNVLVRANNETFTKRSAGQQIINTGRIIVVKSSDSASGNVINGSSSVSLAKYLITAIGEDERVGLYTLVNGSNPNTNLKNEYFLINGVRTSDWTYSLTSSYFWPQNDPPLIVAKNTSVMVEIKADISGSNGDTIQLKLKTTGQGQSSATTIPASEVSGNVLTLIAQ